MTAPTLQAEGALAVATSGNLTPVLPGHAADDMLVACWGYWGPNSTSLPDVATPSGWTLISQLDAPTPDGKFGFFRKRATSSSETDPTFTRPAGWDTGNDTCWGGRCYVVRGVETVDGNGIWDASAIAGPYSTANQPVAAITVSGSERTVIHFLVKHDDFVTAPTVSGWTAGTALESASGTDHSQSSFRKENVSSDTGADASTVEATAQGRYIFWGVSWKPPASSAVSDMVQAIYHVRAASSDTIRPVFHIRALVSDTIRPIFHVRTTVSDTARAIWNLRGLAPQTVRPMFHIRAVVSDTLRPIWHVRAVVSDTSRFIWNVLSSATAVSDIIVLKWRVRAIVSDTIRPMFHVRARMGNILRPVFHVRATVSDTTRAIWDVRAVVAKTVRPLFSVRSMASDTIRAIWNVKLKKYDRILCGTTWPLKSPFLWAHTTTCPLRIEVWPQRPRTLKTEAV